MLLEQHRHLQISQKSHMELIHAEPTKVNVKESSIGPFNQNFLWRSMKSFVHVVDPVSHHRPQSLSVFLHETRKIRYFV